MGRGSLASLHQQLLLRFDSIRTGDGSRLLNINHLRQLDGCLARLLRWGHGVGVAEGALDDLDSSENGFKQPTIKTFEAIYIKLRVVGTLLKERGRVGREGYVFGRHC